METPEDDPEVARLKSENAELHARLGAVDQAVVEELVDLRRCRRGEALAVRQADRQADEALRRNE